MDEISDGGFNAFNNGTATSLAFPVNNNLREFNYGNADHDPRKLANISYVLRIALQARSNSAGPGVAAFRDGLCSQRLPL